MRSARAHLSVSPGRASPARPREAEARTAQAKMGVHSLAEFGEQSVVYSLVLPCCLLVVALPVGVVPSARASSRRRPIVRKSSRNVGRCRWCRRCERCLHERRWR